MSTVAAWPYRLDRIVTIEAPRTTVFSFFTDSEQWARWWGTGSTIDARPGGRVVIRHPGGVEVAGEVLDIEAPARITFTYGYASGSPIPEGGSRVTIALDEVGAGTRLHLSHEFSDEAARDQHVQGWRYQLALFANLVTDQLHAGAEALIDRWFSAWNEPDPVRRREVFEQLTAADVQFRDKYGLTGGTEELLGHIAAVHQFMPGLRLQRAGDVRHCQGLALADWVAVGTDGSTKALGTNAFTLDPRGRIAAVTGFWSRPSS
jgi:uncharacterized protein YndB with AHSA1/START domain